VKEQEMKSEMPLERKQWGIVTRSKNVSICVSEG
jgi:hypothetical protein